MSTQKKRRDLQTHLPCDSLSQMEYDEFLDYYDLSDNSDDDITTTYTPLTPVKFDDIGPLGLEVDRIKRNMLDMSTQSPLNVGNPVLVESVDCEQPSTSNQTSTIIVNVQPTETLLPIISTDVINVSPQVNQNMDIEQVQAIEVDEDGDDTTPLSLRIKNMDGIWENKDRNISMTEFKEMTGPQLDDAVQSPVDIFKCFKCLFPDTFIDHIVYQTNLYAAQKGDGGQIQGTTSNEFIRFLAGNFMMGITRKPSCQ